MRVGGPSSRSFNNGRWIDEKLGQEFWKTKRACLCFVQVTLAQITWNHNIALMDEVKDANEHI